jgi:hypothetical protein
MFCKNADGVPDQSKFSVDENIFILNELLKSGSPGVASFRPNRRTIEAMAAVSLY